MREIRESLGGPRPIQGSVDYSSIGMAPEGATSGADDYYARHRLQPEANPRTPTQQRYQPKHKPQVDAEPAAQVRVAWMGHRSGSTKQLAKAGDSIFIPSSERGRDYFFQVGQVGYMSRYDYDNLQDKYLFRVEPINE